MDEPSVHTVIVVGAGASQEFGLPPGARLAELLAKDLRFSTDHFGRPIPDISDPELVRAVEKYARDSQKNVGELLRHANVISQNMVLAPSIDNFLDTHKQNSDLVFLGRAAIANAIAKAERASTLYIKDDNIYNRMNFKASRNSWASALFKLLVAERSFESFLGALSRIAFVSFNYDRCIKHFFLNAAMSYFDVGSEEGQRVAQSLNIIHPYGSLGDLQIEGHSPSSFGFERHPEILLNAASKIRTFTEGVEDAEQQEKIRSVFGSASLVIFLGFAFLDINMKLLKPERGEARRILATAKGRSVDTKRLLSAEIENSFVKNAFTGKVELVDAKCFELFSLFDHFLLSQFKA